jgi:hypothetical protein
MSTLTSWRKSKTSVIGSLESWRSSKTQYDYLNSWRSSKTDITSAPVYSWRRSKTFITTPYLYNHYIQVWSGGWPPANHNPSAAYFGAELPQIMPECIPTFKANNVDMSDYLIELEINRVLGGKATFSAKFRQTIDTGTYVDYERALQKFPADINPLFRGLATFNETILSHKYDTTRKILIQLTVGKPGQGYQTWQAPLFAPGTPRFDGYMLEWSGEDFSCIFEQEDQEAEDITPTTNTGQTAHGVIKEVLQSYGVTKYELNFPDYRIRQLRRQGGRPIDWMDYCAKPYNAQRMWEGDKLIYSTPRNPDLLTPKFRFVDQINIQRDGLIIEETDDWKNRFNISRLSDQSGNYGEIRCGPGTECPGRTINLVFDEPLNYCQLLIETFGQCTIEDFVWFDEADRPINTLHQLPALYSPIKAARVEATCRPTWFGANNPLALMINLVGYKIVARGGFVNSAFSDNYSFTIQDNPSISVFGLRPEYSNIEDPIIPDAEVAQAYLQAMLEENIRKIYKMELNLPTNYVNPFINPGDCVSVTDYLTSQGDLNWLVESSQIRWDGEKWNQSLTLSRGLIS